ncbi:MAG TPA: ChbG/HpnK family deacetylase [Gemmatimonadales bacterium]|nr:ChbG/HpnK family deacetylase [Gemmatimonadales bacterium]
MTPSLPSVRRRAPAAQQPTLNQRLGYSPSARLLILHLDDIGMLHATNAAAAAAFETGVANSGSLMVPCQWFPEAAAYARAHPALDLGLHLTFTSERPAYRWGPVLGAASVPTLVDEQGYFPITWDESRRVDLRELEAELRAQLARARLLGVVPTHLDSHEHRLQWLGRPIFELFLRVATEQRLPIRVGRNWFEQYTYLAPALGPEGIALDRAITIPPSVPPDQWINWYVDTLHELRPGVTELFLHVGRDDEELRAFAPPQFSWGAAWRQRDLEAITSPAVRDALVDAEVTLITWRQIGRLLVDKSPRAPER